MFAVASAPLRAAHTAWARIGEFVT